MPEAMVRFGIGRNDHSGLNVGGVQVVEVKRSHLLQFEESALASMSGGRPEERLDWDVHGNVFFDHSPGCTMPSSSSSASAGTRAARKRYPCRGS